MNKRRLKREWYFILGVITTIMFIAVVNNYIDYLQKCDMERGYTCNIFGK